MLSGRRLTVRTWSVNEGEPRCLYFCCALLCSAVPRPLLRPNLQGRQRVRFFNPYLLDSQLILTKSPYMPHLLRQT